MEELLHNVDPRFLYLLPPELLDEAIDKKTVTDLIHEQPHLKLLFDDKKGENDVYWVKRIKAQLKKNDKIYRATTTISIIKYGITIIKEYYEGKVLSNLENDDKDVVKEYDPYLEYIYIRLAYIIMIDGKITTLFRQLHPFLIQSKGIIDGLESRGFLTLVQKEILNWNQLWDWWSYWESRSLLYEKKCYNRAIFHIAPCIGRQTGINNIKVDNIFYKRHQRFNNFIKKDFRDLYFTKHCCINGNDVNLKYVDDTKLMSSILCYIIEIIITNYINLTSFHYKTSRGVNLNYHFIPLIMNYDGHKYQARHEGAGNLDKILRDNIYNRTNIKTKTNIHRAGISCFIYDRINNVIIDNYHMFYMYLFTMIIKKPLLLSSTQCTQSMMDYIIYNLENISTNEYLKEYMSKRIISYQTSHQTSLLYYMIQCGLISQHNMKNERINNAFTRPEHCFQLLPEQAIKNRAYANFSSGIYSKPLDFTQSKNISIFISNIGQFDIIKAYQKEQSETIKMLLKKMKKYVKLLNTPKANSTQAHIYQLNDKKQDLEIEIAIKLTEIIFPLLIPKYSWWLDTASASVAAQNSYITQHEYFLNRGELVDALKPHFYGLSRKTIEWVINHIGYEKYNFVEHNDITNIPKDAVFFQLTSAWKEKNIK